MRTRGPRALLRILGAAIIAAAALQAWPSDKPSDEGAAAGKTSSLPGVAVEEEPDSLDADRGGSDAFGLADYRWRRVALGFASDLASHDGDHEAWHQRLSLWVTPALSESYWHAEPRLLPTAGSARVVAWKEGVGVVEAVVAAQDGPALVLLLEERPGARAWVVSFAAERPQSALRGSSSLGSP